MNTHTPSIIAYRVPQPEASLRLFCFPYAGAGASIFRAWTKSLPQTVELCPVQLPGRETRAMEKAQHRMGSLIETLLRELQPYLDLPYAFFGYSMGVLIAFELARALKTHHQLTPLHLFLAARCGPRFPASSCTAELTDGEFVKELERIGGAPKAVLECPDMLELMLPTIRADFALCENYRYAPGLLLDCPLTIFGGKDDPKISHEALAAWDEETNSRCTVKMLDGDHFFLHSCQSAIIATVLKELAGSSVPKRLATVPNAVQEDAAR
jgi:surfactin synthase thioesterase subunit